MIRYWIGFIVLVGFTIFMGWEFVESVFRLGNWAALPFEIVKAGRVIFGSFTVLYLILLAEYCRRWVNRKEE